MGARQAPDRRERQWHIIVSLPLSRGLQIGQKSPRAFLPKDRMGPAVLMILAGKLKRSRGIMKPKLIGFVGC